MPDSITAAPSRTDSTPFVAAIELTADDAYGEAMRRAGESTVAPETLRARVLEILDRLRGSTTR